MQVDPQAGEVAVRAYSGSPRVTPANPDLSPVDLRPGQGVMVSNSGVTERPPVQQIYLPVVNSGR